jgi:hypothetical protein
MNRTKSQVIFNQIPLNKHDKEVYDGYYKQIELQRIQYLNKICIV